MIKVLNFCILKFYDNYVISIINEDVQLTVEMSNTMSEIALNYYKEKPFVYITHRLHNYTVDTNVYTEISKIKTLAGFVVISDGKPSIKNALFEKLFIDKPFQIFDYLEDAILWADNTCNLHGNKSNNKKIKK